MSFNLRYGTAEDGPNSWPFRREAALSVIGEFDPDILGLQEALDFQITEIVERFPHFGWVGVGRDDGISAGEFAPVLFRRGSLDPRESGTFWFSETPSTAGSRYPECFHPRICTWARFAGWSVYNLHLDNESSAARIAAVQQLLSGLEHPAFVMGDFNAGEGDRCVDLMRKTGFRDAYRVIQPVGGPGTYHGFGAATRQEKIDYIWIDAGWQVADAAIVTGRSGPFWPSDHYPITAVVDLTGSSYQGSGPS